MSPAEASGTPAPARLRLSPGSGVTGRLGKASALPPPPSGFNPSPGATSCSPGHPPRRSRVPKTPPAFPARSQPFPHGLHTPARQTRLRGGTRSCPRPRRGGVGGGGGWRGDGREENDVTRAAVRGQAGTEQSQAPRPALVAITPAQLGAAGRRWGPIPALQAAGGTLLHAGHRHPSPPSRPQGPCGPSGREPGRPARPARSAVSRGHRRPGGCRAHPPPPAFNTSPARGVRGEKAKPDRAFRLVLVWLFFVVLFCSFFPHVYLISKKILKLKYIKQWQLALLKLK